MFQESITGQRSLGRAYSRKKVAVSPDDVGGKHSFKADCSRSYGYHGYRGLNLKAYLRYLESRVGANWDLVFSDIKQMLRKEELQRLVPHLDGWVLLHTYCDADGKVMASQRGCADVPVESSYYRFYVHPVNRRLAKVENVCSPRRQRQEYAAAYRARVEETRRELPDGALAMRLGGAWYRVELAAVVKCRDPMAWYYNRQRDVVLNRDIRYLWSSELTAQYGTPGVYAASKRQLSSKEIAKYGLPV